MWNFSIRLAFWFLGDDNPPISMSERLDAGTILLGSPISGRTISRVFKVKDDVQYQTYLMELLTYHYLFMSKQVTHIHSHIHVGSTKGGNSTS